MEVADHYVSIAENLVESIESDHLLAILLETPTDINEMSIFDIALEFEMSDFLDNNRVGRIMTHMWLNNDFLNPNLTFATKEYTFDELAAYLIKKPNHFYYSPVGMLP